MAIRQAIVDFLAAGPLPSEDESEEAIEQAQNLLERVESEAPLTDEEAQALVSGFGIDNCFGLAWTLLHVIETAPGAMTTDYPANTNNYWVDLLRRRSAPVVLAATCAPHSRPVSGGRQKRSTVNASPNALNDEDMTAFRLSEAQGAWSVPYGPDYIRSAQRAAHVPPLSPSQLAAMAMLDQLNVAPASP